jgi:predicted oxidoreductase
VAIGTSSRGGAKPDTKVSGFFNLAQLVFLYAHNSISGLRELDQIIWNSDRFHRMQKYIVNGLPQFWIFKGGGEVSFILDFRF